MRNTTSISEGRPMMPRAQAWVRARMMRTILLATAFGIAGVFATANGAPDATPAPASGADVQKAVQEAIELLAVTAEQEQEKVKKVFEQIKRLPNEAALSEVCKWLTNDEATKRRSAVYILGGLQWKNPNPAFPALRELLKHQESLTRGMAAITLGTLGDTASYDAIVKMAQEDADSYARRCAAYGLGELGDIRALEPLKTIRADKDGSVAANAQNAEERLTFLHDNESASGDAKQVVRGIWIISGSTPWNSERLDRAITMIQSADPAVSKTVLDKAAASPSVAIQNSVKFAETKLAGAAGASSK